MTKRACVACGRSIDAAARTCPYCGANPASGEKVDTQAIVQEVFKARQLTASESVLEYARQRQGIVIAVSCILVFLILAGLHQFVTMRNNSAVTAAGAVPLTEITDLRNRPSDGTPLPMPELNFPYEGRPQALKTLIAEPGAVTPPEVMAAQQAAQQAVQTGTQGRQPAGQPAAQARPGPAGPAVVGPPRPPARP